MPPSKRAPPTGWKGRALTLAMGAILALGHAPFYLPFTVIIAVPVLFWQASALGPGRAFRLGWLAGVGYFAVALNWIVSPFLVDVARHGWMAPFALVFMAGGLALFWGGGFALGRLGRPSGVLALLALAGAWTLAEYARSTMLTGFPWALIAYIWVDTGFMQIASVAGPHGLGLLTLLLFGGLGLVARYFYAAAAGVVAASAAIWLGLAALLPHSVEYTSTTLRIIQPNIPQHLKWNPDHQQEFFNRHVQATALADGADAVIWPEAALPYLLNDRPDLNAHIAEVAGEDTRVIMGALRRDENNGIRNALAVLGADGEVTATYDKSHLVPFGEYLPFPSLFDALGLEALAANAGGLTPGPEGPKRITTGNLPPFQALICYEAIFPHEILRGEARADWLLQVTNDAWFGEVSGPFQHLTQAQFRAVEFGLPVVRAANTGVSAVIDPYGRLVAFLGLGEQNAIDALLPAPRPPTLYSRAGDSPVIVLSLLFVAVGVALSRSRADGQAKAG